jgi:WD40 repeat protein
MSKSSFWAMVILSLTACSAAAQQNAVGPVLQSATVRRSAPPADALLYVADAGIRYPGSVVVHDMKSGKLLETITDGVDVPVALAVDPSGNLYVANRGAKDITVYGPGSAHPSQTISQGITHLRRMRFDPAGELNVIDGSTLTVYDPSTGELVRTIKNKLHLPYALAFDPAGDLFVLNADYRTNLHDVVEYAPGSSKVTRTFAVGSQFENPDDLAIGPDGDVYIADDNYVQVFDPNTGSLVRTITSGVYGTITLAFDSTGNMFVSNDGASNGIISVYAPEASSPSYEITQDDAYSFGLLFDAKNDLYLASTYGGASNHGMVAEFKPGETGPNRVIETGLEYPDAAALGPK